MATIRQRLEYLRGELRAERISYGELHELQSYADHIPDDDAELLKAAGVPEGQRQQPGYVSVKGGKWHRAIVAKPTFTHEEQTACGLTVQPLNVTWHGKKPDYARPDSFCKHCEAKAN